MSVFVGYYVKMGIKKVQFNSCVIPRSRAFSEALGKVLFNAKNETEPVFLGIIKAQ